MIGDQYPLGALERSNVSLNRILEPIILCEKCSISGHSGKRVGEVSVSLETLGPGHMIDLLIRGRARRSDLLAR